MIIEDILEDFCQKCKQHSIKLQDLKLDMIGHVVDLTGPKRMTRGIVKSLESILNDNIDDRYDRFSLPMWPWRTSSQLMGLVSSLFLLVFSNNVIANLLGRKISGLFEPKLISDVLILPGNSFGALQNEFPQNEGPALVTHHYAGSWKNDHGREVV
jgi:hypothetical protein